MLGEVLDSCILVSLKVELGSRIQVFQMAVVVVEVVE